MIGEKKSGISLRFQTDTAFLSEDLKSEAKITPTSNFSFIHPKPKEQSRHSTSLVAATLK